MAWKKSNDGGIDFEVEELIEQHKREKQPEEFNPFATAMTMTFDFNQEEVEFEDPEVKLFVNPKNTQERIHNLKARRKLRIADETRRGLR